VVLAVAHRVLGPLSTPFGRRLFGASAPLAALLFVIGFGQGVGLPTLMRMVTGRVAPALSGMIAGIASSTLQLSTALSVALIGGIFYTVLEARSDPAAITKAFIVAILCIAGFLAAGVGLSITLARRRPRIAGG